MRVTDIKLTIKHNLGNWEHCEFSAEAVVDEEDNLNVATLKLTNYVDWHALKRTRDNRKKTYELALTDPNITEDKKAEAEKWLAKYEERKAEVEGL